MPAKWYSTEQIVSKLRQAELELRRDLRVPVVCKKLGISEPTYYRWRKEYGSLRLDQAKRLKELERETTRLKKLVARRLRSTHVLETLAQLFVTYGVPAQVTGKRRVSASSKFCTRDDVVRCRARGQDLPPRVRFMYHPGGLPPTGGTLSAATVVRHARRRHIDSERRFTCTVERQQEWP